MERLLTGMHMVAVPRGDGLLPELATALSKRCSNDGGGQAFSSYELDIAIQQDHEAKLGPSPLRR